MHNDANVLVMGERVIGRGVALDIVKAWLETEFEGSRHQRRLDKIREIETSIGSAGRSLQEAVGIIMHGIPGSLARGTMPRDPILL